MFFETAKAIQTRLTDQFLQTVLQGTNKDSLAKAMKELFREFDSKPFLYDVNTSDFRAFVSKLSEQDMEEIKFESIGFFREVCRAAQLKPKIDETQAFGVLSALLATISAKQTLSEICDYFEIFDFMVDNLIAEMGIKMNISQIIVKIYEGLLQFVPFFRVIWIGTVVLGFAYGN